MVSRAALGQVSSKYFGFPCHSFNPLIPPQSSAPIIQGWYNRPINDHSNNGFDYIPAKKIKKIVGHPILFCILGYNWAGIALSTFGF
jgi:hypothetical protein